MIRFILNNDTIATDLPAGTVLLDYIRYHQHLTGTKIGCREGDCGACTVLVGSLEGENVRYRSMTSCLMPVGNASGKHIVTIEGINFHNELNPVQQAMAEEGGTQCGFCTPGFVMSLAGYCLSENISANKNVIAAIDGNICRCTGYKPIERAAERIAVLVQQRGIDETNIDFVTRNKILPDYFNSIPSQLSALHKKISSENQLTDTDSIIVGGGTDLYVQKHDAMPHANVRLVSDDENLKGIRREGDKCILGAAVTVSDLRSSELINSIFPNFQQHAKLVSSTPIRNMATIAGNFINASPIGDFTIFFLALDAQLVLSNGTTIRELPLRKLYKGYKTLDKTPDEYIVQVWFTIPGNNQFFHFEKVSKRTHLDIASVNSALLLTMSGNKIIKADISAGGVGPIPLFLQKTSAFLQDKIFSDTVIAEAMGIMKSEISPISDARGSKEYKTLLLAQLIKAHFLQLVTTA